MQNEVLALLGSFSIITVLDLIRAKSIILHTTTYIWYVLNVLFCYLQIIVGLVINSFGLILCVIGVIVDAVQAGHIIVSRNSQVLVICFDYYPGVSRQKSHICIIHVYVHNAEDFCYILI